MPSYTGTAGNDSWNLISPGTFTLDGLAGTDTLNLGTSLRSSYTFTLAADGAVHIDSISGASGALHATLYHMEVLTFNSGKDVMDLTTYFGAQPAPTVGISDNIAGTAIGNVTYSLAFSQSVVGLTASDFTIGNGSVVSVSGSGANYSVVVAPAANTEGSMSLTLNAGAVSNAAGTSNTSAAFAATQAIDTKAPTVGITDGTNGTATGNVTYSLVFSEAVTGLTATGLTVTNGSVVSVSGSGANYSVVLAPAANTEGSMGLSLNAAAVSDLPGNPMVAVAAPAQVIDTKAPTVLTFSPAVGATGIAVASNLALTFSEAIVKGAGNLVLKTGAGVVLETYDVASSNLSIDGNTVTINPTADLAFGTTYTLELAAGAFKDLAGNSYAGTSSYTFSTLAASNAAPTGAVSITGTAMQGQTLTAGNDLADADGLGTIHYQWQSNGLAISGGTAATLPLGEAQVGTAITVVASYTDGRGTQEHVSSAASTAVLNVNDAPTGVVTITGAVSVGQTLTVSNTLADADGMGVIHYQWQAGGQALSGATGSSYVLAATDVAESISVLASYVDGHGTAESVSSAALYMNTLPTGHVTVSGAPLVGSSLSAANSLSDADGLGTIHYQWLADGVAISGATTSTFLLGSAQLAQALDVVASYTDGHGTLETVASQASVVQTATAANVSPAEQSVVSTLVLTPVGASTPTQFALSLNTNNAGTDILSFVQATSAPVPTGMPATLGVMHLTADLSAQGHTALGESFSLYVDKSLPVNGFWVQQASGTWVNLSSAPYGGQTVFEGNKIRLDFTISDGSSYDADPAIDHLAVTGVVANIGLSLIGHVADAPAGGFHF